jgi:hypothetical protein
MPDTVSASVEYKLSDNSVSVSESVAIHEEVGGSEFDYALAGTNPDDGSEMILFGFHEDELDLPLPTSKSE